MLTFPASEEIQRAQRACVEHLGSLGAKDVQKIDMAVRGVCRGVCRVFVV